MLPLNTAQQLMQQLGIPVEFRDKTIDPRNIHPTKKGPGRRHQQYASHGRKAQASKGTAEGFVQHKNPQTHSRRIAIVEAGGIRQYKKLIRSMENMRRNLMPRKEA